MAQLPRGECASVHDPAAMHETTAHTGADGDICHQLPAAALPENALTQGGRVGVVFQRHRQAERFLQHGGERFIGKSHGGDVHDPPLLQIQRPGTGHSGREHVGYPGVLAVQKGLDRFRDPADQLPAAAFRPGRHRLFSYRPELAVIKRHRRLGAPDIHPQKVCHLHTPSFPVTCCRFRFL